MKSIKGLLSIVILVVAIGFAGCQAPDTELTLEKDHSVPEEVVETVAQEDASNDADMDIPADGFEDDFRTLEEVLGRDVELLSEEQLEVLRDLYSEIEVFEFLEDGSTDDAYYDLLDNFDYKMMDYGLDVPFISYVEVADKYKSKISDADYKKIESLNDAYFELIEQQMEATEDDEYDALYEEAEALEGKIEVLFDKNGLPGEEVSTQIENRSVHYALYEVNNAKITLSDDSMETADELAVAEKDLYHRLWKHIVKIVPREYMDLLVKYEVNTDGVDNVMAHVVEEAEDFSQWRLAIDLKDAINPDGSFSDEFTNTVIHEFAHVMTLHKGQLQGATVTDDTAFSTQEGYLKTESYLNQFYQEFWKNIKEEHSLAEEIDAVDETQSGQGIYGFYEKYEDQFVSDYAATNPGEDIAETYRVFVMDDKPTGDTIKDKKVLFMYGYPELVKIRMDIRTALGMSK